MRRMILVILLVGATLFALIPTASAHVHAITPLACSGLPDNPNSGATKSPHSGVIPFSVGSAQGLELFGGGFQAAGPHCP